MTREPEVVTYYTLEEAKRLIRREGVRKRKRFWRSAKQKFVGAALIIAVAFTGEIAAMVFAVMLGLYLIFTKEKWMQGLFLLDNMAYMPYNTHTKDTPEEFMSKFEVEFYELDNGIKPAKEFILSQAPKMRAKLLGLVDILEENGTELRKPYSAPLGDGIFEQRCIFGNDIARVLYFFYYEGKIICTNGFIKKTQKTPPEEIEKAKKYRARFLERNGK